MEVAARNNGILLFPEFTGDLSESERLEVESRRIHDRVAELLGDEKEMVNHRKNLKSIFSNTKDPMLLKTWRALDAQLEADIKYTESLLAQ